MTSIRDWEFCATDNWGDDVMNPEPLRLEIHRNDAGRYDISVFDLTDASPYDWMLDVACKDVTEAVLTAEAQFDIEVVETIE